MKPLATLNKVVLGYGNKLKNAQNYKMQSIYEKEIVNGPFKQPV